MAETKTRRRERMIQDERAGIIAPDQSISVFDFEDGWQIVRLATVGDVRREAHLMRNCAAKYVGDVLDEDRMWVVIESSDIPDDSPAPVLDSELRKLHQIHYGCMNDMRLHSLRDKMGISHATFWAHDDNGIAGIDGYRNSSPIRLVYRQRIEQWADEKHLVLMDSSEDAGCVIRGRQTQDRFTELIMQLLNESVAAYPARRVELRKLAWRAFDRAWDIAVCERGLAAFSKDTGWTADNLADLNEIFGKRMQDNEDEIMRCIDELISAGASALLVAN